MKENLNRLYKGKTHYLTLKVLLRPKVLFHSFFPLFHKERFLFIAACAVTATSQSTN